MAWLRDGLPWGTTREARELDQRALAELGLPGLVLMETAGGQAAEAIWRAWEARSPASPRPPRLACLCGGGNNGGDGFVVARRLVERADVVCIVATDADDSPADARVMRRAATACGIEMMDVRDTDQQVACMAWLREVDIVVDAVLGTGSRRPVAGGARRLLEALESSAAHGLRSGLGTEGRLVAALDLPSGGCGDSGQRDSLTPRCHLTITFGIAKVGLGLAPLVDLAGRLVVADLGLPLAFRTGVVPKTGRKDLP